MCEPKQLPVAAIQHDTFTRQRTRSISSGMNVVSVGYNITSVPLANSENP